MDGLSIKNIYWEKVWKIPGVGWTIRGYSRSAYRTGFYIPDLDLMLDAGPQNFNKPRYILITHTHIDHVACLPLTMIGDIHGEHVFEIYGPEQSEKFIHDYISSMFSLNAVEQMTECRKWYNYHGLISHNFFEQFFAINCKGNTLEIQVIKCDHGVPTIGYGISERKNKLKREYLSLSGKEIVELKKQGISLTEIITVKRLAYICDTSVNVFSMNENIFNYPVIFIECTFFSPDELENAERTKHIHWDQLKEHVISHSDNTFVLFHFSQRYRDHEIKTFFENECEKLGISNIHCWTGIKEYKRI
jgi:ribonuclease Z